MASTYQRREQWWIKFQHPGTKKLIRESLQTSDASRAALLCKRIELEVALLDPRFQTIELPSRIRDEIGISIYGLKAASASSPRPITVPAPAVLNAPAKPRVTIEDAVSCYIQYITDQNAPATRANKISMIRRFIGNKRAEAIVGPSESTKRFGAHRPKRGSTTDVAFQGTYLDEISASVVQQFIDRLGLSTKTKRHYREFFHQFFEVCLRFDLYLPTSHHRPNPIAALPNYTTKNRRIIYLKSAQIEQQHNALVEYPAIQIAVDIMIHAGLRRSEVLWLERDSIDSDLSFIKILNGYDDDEDIEGSLKTGQRAVTILPQLRATLDRYLQQLKSKWVIPTPEGTRWSKDGFSRRLRIMNKTHSLRWTCNHYRHTYATQRAAEGWPLFRIAKEMGNSVAVVEEYYAAYVRPHESTISAT